MLKGYDVSHWQTKIPAGQYDFLICKASEGKTTKDKAFKKHLESARAKGIDLLGAYHYARTNNTPEEDAKNFLNAIKDVPELRTNLLLALDLEGIDLKRKGSIEWAKKWMDIVYENTGIKPVIYIQGSYTKKIKLLKDADYGLWVAHWNVSHPATGVYPAWALWQYKASGYDFDYFNGNRIQYLKYCKGGVNSEKAKQ